MYIHKSTEKIYIYNVDILNVTNCNLYNFTSLMKFYKSFIFSFWSKVFFLSLKEIILNQALVVLRSMDMSSTDIERK